MTHLQHLVAFVQTAEHGSFSLAARHLGMTPAGISKNVARLESLLGLRLFHRSTRRLSLTEAGERLLQQITGPLDAVQGALSGALVSKDDRPAGTLKVSMGQALGRHFLVPLLGEFMARYPAIVPDWHFDNRRVDLVGEGFDAAIGGGFELNAAVVARELSRVHIVAVAAPAYLANLGPIDAPGDLAQVDGIMRRSSPSGRVRPWRLQTTSSPLQPVPCRPRLILSDPEAIAQAARQGLGVALLPMLFAFAHLHTGELVRVLPGWYEDVGPLSLYYPGKKLLPAKTRVFVDYIVARFENAGFAKIVDAR